MPDAILKSPDLRLRAARLRPDAALRVADYLALVSLSISARYLFDVDERA